MPQPEGRYVRARRTFQRGRSARQGWTLRITASTTLDTLVISNSKAPARAMSFGDAKFSNAQLVADRMLMTAFCDVDVISSCRKVLADDQPSDLSPGPAEGTRSCDAKDADAVIPSEVHAGRPDCRVCNSETTVHIRQPEVWCCHSGTAGVVNLVCETDESTSRYDVLHPDQPVPWLTICSGDPAQTSDR